MTKSAEAQQPSQSQPDVMPDPIDDNRPDAADAAADGQPAVEAAQETAPTVRLRGDETRDSIAAKFRQLRDQKRGEHAAAEALDVDERPDAEDTPEPTAPREPARAADSRPATPPAVAKAPAVQPQQNASTSEQEPEVLLKVDGKLQRVPLSKAIDLAQIGAASENRLEEAKRILAEAKGIKAAAPANQRAAADAHSEPDPSTKGADAPPANQRGTDLDPDKLGELVERIQIGDKAEGAQAVREILEMRPSISPTEIEQIVERRLTATKTQEDVSGAIERFSSKYPTLVTNPLLVDASKTALREEIAKDILALGVPETDLAPIRHDEKALAQTVRALREGGLPVRTYDQLLDSVGQTMTQTFNIQTTPATQPASRSPQQSPPAQRTGSDAARDRLALKRAAPQQPRAAGIRADAPREAPPKTKADIVNEMRAARGFRRV